MPRRRLIVLLAFSICVPGGAAGQSRVPVEPGNRVRVQLQDSIAQRFGRGPWVVGDVLIATEDSIALRVPIESEIFRASARELVGIEVSAPVDRRQRIDSSMGVGFGLGALAGALYVIGVADRGCLSDGECRLFVGGGMVVGGLVGLISGAIWGSLPTEVKWQEASLPPSE